MNEQDFKLHLEQQGYKICPNNLADEIAFKWLACKRLDTLIYCMCNEKPPQYTIEGFDPNVFNKVGNDLWPLSYKISVKAEDKLGNWCDLGYYSLSVDELDILPEIERKLLKAWEVLNE